MLDKVVDGWEDGTARGGRVGGGSSKVFGSGSSKVFGSGSSKVFGSGGIRDNTLSKGIEPMTGKTL